jgi:G:T-mismatch repair DNA endonuclease (very short patch repair protein)
MEIKYHKEQWSLPCFKKEHGLRYEQTIFLLEYYNIEKRGVKEANSLPKKTDRYKKTCLEKYGYENVSQVEEIKDQKIQTCLKNNGIENVWKSKKYHEKLAEQMTKQYGKGSVPNKNGNANYWGWKTADDATKKKRHNDRVIVYKKWYSNLTDDQKIAQTAKHAIKGNKSKLEKRVAYLLSELGIDYSHQYWISHRSFDFHIQNTKILLEINVDFWHANPKLYKSEDVIHFPLHDVTAQQLWDKDRAKQTLANKHGYKVLYVWEEEIRKKSDTEVKNLLTKILI